MNIDNELIADFMGEVNPFKDHSILPFRYDTSFDWIIPVVDKIESLGFCTNLNYNPDTNIKYFSIYDSMYRDTAKGKHFYFEGDKCIYKAVVKFILWYNLENSIK